MYNYLVEFLGTAFFVYVILATGNPLAIGAALALTMLLTLNISGGYINPAVTIVMASAGKITTTDIIPYCLA
jgi:glycerol uptake facilitator-like aquaporin